MGEWVAWGCSPILMKSVSHACVLLLTAALEDVARPPLGVVGGTGLRVARAHALLLAAAARRAARAPVAPAVPACKGERRRGKKRVLGSSYLACQSPVSLISNSKNQMLNNVLMK